MEDGETIDSIRIQRECPSLLPSLKIDMSSNNPLIDEIFQICNPSNQKDHEKEHFNVFERIHTIVVKLIEDDIFFCKSLTSSHYIWKFIFDIKHKNSNASSF